MKGYGKWLATGLAVCAAVALGGCPGPMTWVKTFGGTGQDQAYGITYGGFGRILVAGYSDSGSNGQDMELIEVESTGGLNWRRTYGETGMEAAMDIVGTRDGGYLLAGYQEADGDRNVYVVKVDSDGNLLWSRTYGGPTTDETAMSIARAANSGYIIAGESIDPGFISSNSNALLVKIDEDGSEAWLHTYGSSGAQGANGVVGNPDGSFTFAGYTDSEGAGADDVWLVKVSSAGGLIWDHTYGGGDDDFALDIVPAFRGYVVAGQTASFGRGGTDAYMIHTDDKGEVIWSNTYGGSEDESAFSVQLHRNGVVFTGFTETFGNGASDLYLLRTDNTGQFQWSRTFGGDATDIGTGVVPHPGGGYLLSGYTDSFGSGEDDFYVIRTDAFGNAG